MATLASLLIDMDANVARLSERAVRATEAAVLTPAMALHGGFVDAIASFPDALDMLQASLSTATV